MAITKATLTGDGGQGLEINDIAVVGEQGAVVADSPAAPGEPATLAAAGVDLDAITIALNLVIARLRSHGLIAT